MSRILTIAATVWREVLRRKDVYVLIILLAALLLSLVSLNVFGLGGVARYALDVGLLMVWVLGTALAVIVTARQLPQEQTRGTVFSLLATPVTRFEVIAGKWLGAWTVVCMATAVLYLLVFVVTLAMGGEVGIGTALQGILLHLMAQGVICSITLALSTRMNSDATTSLSFVLAAASFLIVPRIPEFMTRASGLSSSLLLTIYSLLPHYEVFDLRKRIVHQYGPADWHIAGTVVLYGVTLIALFLLVAWLAYRRRRFSRTDIA